MWNTIWELFLEVRKMKMGWKSLGRIWGVPSLFRNFLGNFPCKENGFGCLLCTLLGCSYHFLLGWVADTRASTGASAYGAVLWTGFFIVLWTHSSLSLVHVDRVHRGRGKGSWGCCHVGSMRRWRESLLWVISDSILLPVWLPFWPSPTGQMRKGDGDERQMNGVGIY
jgi:hypothetical protein